MTRFLAATCLSLILSPIAMAEVTILSPNHVAGVVLQLGEQYTEDYREPPEGSLTFDETIDLAIDDDTDRASGHVDVSADVTPELMRFDSSCDATTIVDAPGVTEYLGVAATVSAIRFEVDVPTEWRLTGSLLARNEGARAVIYIRRWIWDDPDELLHEFRAEPTGTELTLDETGLLLPDAYVIWIESYCLLDDEVAVFDTEASHHIEFALAEASTPVQVSSWGGVKAAFR